jgi:hypothetical protein
MGEASVGCGICTQWDSRGRAVEQHTRADVHLVMDGDNATCCVTAAEPGLLTSV